MKKREDHGDDLGRRGRWQRDDRVRRVPEDHDAQDLAHDLGQKEEGGSSAQVCYCTLLGETVWTSGSLGSIPSGPDAERHLRLARDFLQQSKQALPERAEGLAVGARSQYK